MFTGLIQKLGRVKSIKAMENSMRLELEINELDMQIGDSLAVNGACLTLASQSGSVATFEVSPETLDRTNFKKLVVGDEVNLEPAMRLSDRLGGHIVQGHVDGVGEIGAIEKVDAYHKVTINYPESLEPYVIEKGSIAVDGVSLTINRLENSQAELMIIPHTWQHTNFKNYMLGDQVNIEVDYLAKYALKQIPFQTGAQPDATQ